MNNFAIAAIVIVTFAAGTLLKDQTYRVYRYAESYVPFKIVSATPPAQPISARQYRAQPVQRERPAQQNQAGNSSSSAAIQPYYEY